MPTDRPPVSQARPGSPETVFGDANVFLRVLTNDVPGQADAAVAFLDRAAAGDLRLVTSVLVVAEIVWTLGSFYKQTRLQVRDAVLALCHTPGLDVEEADALVQAVEWHAELDVDFGDAYHAAWMRSRGVNAISTFNLKHFGRFQDVVVSTPSVPLS